MNPIGIIIAVVFAVIIVTFFVIAIIRNNKIRKSGIETEGVISRIEEKETVDSDGFSDTNYTYYVNYRTTEGKTVEARLGIIMQRRYNIGERINILYLPEKPDYVVLAK